MNYSENALNILTLKTYRGVGRAWIVKNITGNEDESTLVAMLETTLKHEAVSIFEFQQRKARIRTRLEKMRPFADGVVALGDISFPAHRGQVKNSEKPIALFYRGEISLLSQQNKNIAVIGLLEPDASTIAIEQQFVDGLVNKGCTIVSGLALGCDSVAHSQTLRSGGKTVAILPSPLHGILPSSNKALAESIVRNGGLLITEYFEDATSKMELSGRYQERDRLQALFSDAIVLAASYAKNDIGLDSGSRLAMEYALNYGIPRAVLYDEQRDALNAKYDLNRQLLAQNNGVFLIHPARFEQGYTFLLGAPIAANREPEQVGLF